MGNRMFDWILDGAPTAVRQFDEGSMVRPRLPIACALMVCLSISTTPAPAQDGGELSLAGPSDTVWTGAESTDWFAAGNWTNGVPLATQCGVIPFVMTNFPVIDSNPMNAECLDLSVAASASVSLLSDLEDLEVNRNAILAGTLTGIGPLRMIGDGGLSASVTVSAPVVIDTAGTIELQGTLLGLASTLDLVNGTLRSADGNTCSVGGTATFGGGELTGASGELDLDGPAVFSGTVVSEPPTLMLADDLTVDGNFTPAAGLVIFDGNSSHTVTQTQAGLEAQFFDLEIGSGGTVSVDADLRVLGDLECSGSITVDGDIILEGEAHGDPGSELITAGGVVHFRGPAVCWPGIVTTLNVVVDVGAGNTLTILGTVLRICGDLTISSGTLTSQDDLDLRAKTIAVQAGGRFDVAGNRIALNGFAPGCTEVSGVPVTVHGELEVDAGGELAMGGDAVNPGSVAILAGGILRVVGNASAPASVTPASVIGGANGLNHYSLSVGDAAVLQARYFVFRGMDALGLELEPSALLEDAPLDLRDGTFDLAAPGGQLLHILPHALALELVNLRFLNSAAAGGAFNVRTETGSSPVVLKNWSGPFGGPPRESDADGNVFWGSRLEYFVAREQGCNPAGCSHTDLLWRVTRETDAQCFLVQKLFVDTYSTIGTVTATGPGFYQFLDPSPHPAGDAYLLLEEFSPGMGMGIVSELGAGFTNGVLDPLVVPNGGWRRPPPDPIQMPITNSSPGKGPGWMQDTLDDSFAPRGTPLELRLEPGIHPGFIWSARSTSLRLVGASEEPVVIDVSSGPIRIRSVPKGRSVELVNLILERGAGVGPTLVIEDTEGLVLLDGVRVFGGTGEPSVLLSDAHAVVVQDTMIEGGSMHLQSGSLAFLRDGDVAAIQVAGRSRLETWGHPSTVSVAPGSRWTDHGSLGARLEVALSGPSEIELLLHARPGSTWRALHAPCLAYIPLSTRGLPLLLDGATLQALDGSRAVGPDGVDRLRIRWPGDDGAPRAAPLYFQALVRDPGEGTPALSGVCSAHVCP